MTSAGNKLFTVFGGGGLPYLLDQNLLDPAQYSPGGWLFGLHSRDSGATVVDESGNVVWANENLWFPRENLGATYWDGTRASAQEDTGIALPQGLGLTTATKLTEDSTAANNHRLDDTTIPVDADQYLTVSGVFRGDGNRQAAAFGFTSAAAFDAKFHLQTGAHEGGSAVADQGMISLGGGWWRCWATFNPQPGKTRLYIWMGKGDGGSLDDSEFSYDGDGSSFIHLTGMQFQRGRVLGALLLNGDALEPTFTPRLQHDKDGNPLYYLHEPQATKKAVPSYPGDNTENALLGGESSTSLVGLRTYEWIADTTTGIHRIITGSFAAVAGTTYARSFFAKAGDYRYVAMWSTSTGSTVVFDLQTGTVARTTGTAAGEMEEYKDGVYRCVFLQAAIADASLGASIWFSNDPNSNYNDSYAGDGTSIGYIAGINAEVGNATSFLPNDGSGEVVRQADRLSTFLASTIGLDGKTEFTSFVEAVPLGDGDTISLLDVVAPSRALGSLSLVYITGSTNFFPRVQVHGDPVSNFELQYVSTGGGSNYGNTLKLAARFKEDDCRAAYNGTLGVADDGASYITPDVDRVGIMRAGNNSAGGGPTDAPVGIRQLRIIPRGLSDSELQNLTS